MLFEYIKKIIVIFIPVLLSATFASASWVYDAAKLNNTVIVPEFSDVTWNMKQPDFWIQKIKNPAALMFDEQKINVLNIKLRDEKNSNLADFDGYPEVIPAATIAGMINKVTIPRELKYVNGKKVSYDYYRKLDYNRNVNNLINSVKVRYAFTVRQTDMRAFPTDDRIYNRPSNDEIDRFQETRLDPEEPLVVLQTSRDGKWYFVQAFCYSAWVRADDIAFVEKKTNWDEYRKQQFLVVKIPDFCMRDTISNEVLVWEMGARIPLSYVSDNIYSVKIARKATDGNLVYDEAVLDRNTDGIRVGYLPCSYQNIIYQAFKMYGMKFGWGGLYDSVDCSSFAQNVYRSFGIIIPRNSSQQAKMPVKTKEFFGIGGSRYEELNDVDPGTILYMPGHIMIYLGEEDSRHYIIHSFSSFGVLDQKHSIEENAVYAVAVTDMNIYRMSGRTFQDSVDIGKTIK